jgi:hypothetical protein
MRFGGLTAFFERAVFFTPFAGCFRGRYRGMGDELLLFAEEEFDLRDLALQKFGDENDPEPNRLAADVRV